MLGVSVCYFVIVYHKQILFLVNYQKTRKANFSWKAVLDICEFSAILMLI